MDQNAKTHLTYLKQLQVLKFNEIEQHIMTLFNEIVEIQNRFHNNRFLMSTMIYLHHDFMNLKAFFEKIFTETYINDIQKVETMMFIMDMLHTFQNKISLVTNLKKAYFESRILEVGMKLLQLDNDNIK